jgi:hypothetical protein
LATRNNLEWFRPVWRRVLITGFVVAWSGWEWFVNHDQFWGTVTLCLIAYAVWTFFVTFDRNVGPPGPTPPGEDG